MSRLRIHADNAAKQRAYRGRKRNGPNVTPSPEAVPVICWRAEAGAGNWTFQIKPIAALCRRYVGDGKGWVDPFAGKTSPAELTNDLNPNMPTTHHLKALDFCQMVDGPFVGVLFDPPHSYRQVSDCYHDVLAIKKRRGDVTPAEEAALKVTMSDTNCTYYNSVMNAICDKIAPGGLALSFGWNGDGFGKNRGFVVIEMGVVCHGSGGHRNSTIVTVERKL